MVENLAIKQFECRQAALEKLPEDPSFDDARAMLRLEIERLKTDLKSEPLTLPEEARGEMSYQEISGQAQRVIAAFNRGNDFSQELAAYITEQTAGRTSWYSMYHVARLTNLPIFTAYQLPELREAIETKASPALLYWQDADYKGSCLYFFPIVATKKVMIEHITITNSFLSKHEIKRLEEVFTPYPLNINNHFIADDVEACHFMPLLAELAVRLSGPSDYSSEEHFEAIKLYDKYDIAKLRWQQARELGITPTTGLTVLATRRREVTTLPTIRKKRMATPLWLDLQGPN